RAEKFLDETVNFGIAMLVDFSQALLLFVQALAQQPGRIRVVKNVASGLQFHFKLRDAERPRAQRLHQAALEIEKTEQATRVLLDRKLPAQLPAIAWKAVRIGAGSFGRGN